MSTDMRLLILTHLRAALERRDWRAVERANWLCLSVKDWKRFDALGTAVFLGDWGDVEAVYVSLGGMGSGEPVKGPGGAEKAPHGASEGAAA